MTRTTRRNSFFTYFGKRASRSSSKSSLSGHFGDLEKASVSNISCLLSPLSPTRLSWDAIFFLSLFYEIWAFPFEAVFAVDKPPPWHSAMEVAILAVFTIDIILNFLTGYMDSGAIIMDYGRTARRYFICTFKNAFKAHCPT